MKKRTFNKHRSTPAKLRPWILTLLGVLAVFGAGVGPRRLIAGEAPYSLRVVTYLGDAAPGGGVFTNDFEPSALNNRGLLAFTAEPEEPGNEAIFLSDGNQMSEVVRFGQSAPGGGVFGATESGDIGLNDPGDMTFGFQLEQGESVYRLSHQHQTLSPVIIPNVTPVPDGSGLFVGAFGSPGINNQGDIAFLGNVTNPPPTRYTFVKHRTGVFISDKFGRITTVAKPGDAAPGGGTFVSAGALYGSIFGFLFTIFTGNADINERGDIAFAGEVSTAINNFTGFVRRSNTRALETIPPPQGVWTGFVSRISINNRGDVAFLASRDLAGYLFSSSSVGAVCLSRGGATINVATVGDAAPEGGHFTTFGKRLGFNNRGDMAFAAKSDKPDQGIYLRSGATGNLRRIAGTGTVVAGEGVIVDLLGDLVSFGLVTLNDHDQIAFVARITNGTIPRVALVFASPGNGAK